MIANLNSNFINSNEFLFQADILEKLASKVKISDLNSTVNRKALTISAGLIAFQQLSGINIVLFFATDIFSSTGSSLDPNIATIIIGKELI